MILDLYEARVRMYHATPGSKEWRAAIRDIRACHERLYNAVTEFTEAIASAMEGLAEACRPLAELAVKVNANG